MKAKSELSMGPFHQPRLNPTHQITNSTQPNLLPAEFLYPRPDPIQPNPHTTNNNRPGAKNKLMHNQKQPMSKYVFPWRRCSNASNCKLLQNRIIAS